MQSTFIGKGKKHWTMRFSPDWNQQASQRAKTMFFRFLRMMMTLIIWWMTGSKIHLISAPKAKTCHASQKLNYRAGHQAIARSAAQEGAKKVTFAQKNGLSAPSAKRTSVPLTLIRYFIINADILSACSLHAITFNHERSKKNKKNAKNFISSF